MLLHNLGAGCSGKASQVQERVGRYALTSLVGLMLWVSCDAAASIGIPYWPTLYESTVDSDAWVRAGVLNSRETKPSEFNTELGERYYPEVTLEIFEATDRSIPNTIDTPISNASELWAVGDGDRFLALTRQKGAYVHQWTPDYKLQKDGQVDPFPYLSGALVSDTFLWRLMRDTRLLVDGDGEVPTAVRTHWEGVSQDGSPAEVLLALEWLAQLKVSNIDNMALAKNVVRHYTELSALVSENLGVDYKDRAHVLNRLFSAVVSDISRTQHVEAARMLEDLYWQDQSSHHFLNYTRIAPLLAVPATEEQLSKLASLLGKRITLLDPDMKLLARIPGKSVDDLLWAINMAPEEHGVSDLSLVAPLWEGLTRRGDLRIRDYFRAVIQGGEFPGQRFTDPNFASSVKKEAIRNYTLLPRSAEAHEAEMRWLATEGAAGNFTCLSLLARMLRPHDSHLVPLLAKATPTRDYFLKEIILRIPDPAFVPLLESWESEAPSAEMIRAFLACGETQHALDLAMVHMATPVPEAKPDALATVLRERAGLIVAFVEAGNTESALAWIESTFSIERLQRYERILQAAFTEMHPEDVLYDLHRACLDVALVYPGLDKKRAVPWLRWYRDTGESFEAFASLGLMVSGEEGGETQPDTIQEYVESTTPFMRAVPYLLRMNHPQLKSLVLRYFEQDLEGFDRWVEDPDDYRRLGPPFLKLLVDALESGNIRRRSEAMAACAAVLGRNFDYHVAQPRVWNDLAVAEYAESMRRLVAAP